MKVQRSKTSVVRCGLAALCAWVALPVAVPAAGPYRETYGYDAADRLQAVAWDINGTNAAVLVEYDAAGNRTRWVTIGLNDPTLDSDGDGLPDLAELRYFGHLGETGAGDPDTDGLSNSNELAFGSSPILKNTDGDPQNDYAEWIADTSPTNSASYFNLTAISGMPLVRVYFQGSSNRVYTLQSSTNVAPVGWTNVPGQTRIAGSGTSGYLTDTNSAPQRFYRVQVELP